MTLGLRDVDDEVSVGNHLVRAYGNAYQTEFLGLGAPIGHVVAKLQRYRGVLGPNLIVVCGAHRNPGAVASMRSLAGFGSSLILIVDENTPDSVSTLWAPDRVSEASLFALTLNEAVEIAHGTIPPNGVAEALSRCGHRFVPFANAVRSLAGLTPLQDPVPNGFVADELASSGVPAELVLSAFRRRNEHIEAFEYVVHNAPGLAPDAIRDAAPQYVASGMTKRMLRQIEMLPVAERRRSDDLMRWWFAASIAENCHGSVRSEVEQVLELREAAELRALYAAAFPGPELLVETQRAVNALRTPVTLRMHGFALGMQSDGDTGITFLRKALRLSEALADPDQVVGAATDIANYYIRRGHYQDGAEWASWAVEQHYSLRGKDELRRLAAVGLLAFSRVLVEDLVGLEPLLEDLKAATDLIGGPTSEVINSTLGDWAVACGDLATAEQHYRKNLERLPREQYHLAALDLIPVLCSLGKHAEAQVIGRRVRSITRDADKIARALGVLAHALSVVGVDNSLAEGDLEHVCEVLGSGSEAPRLAQASVALARVRLSRDDAIGARKALELGIPGLTGLGPSGWRLVCASHERLDLVLALYRGDKPTLDLSFLGDSLYTMGSDVNRFTKRNAECVAVIATSRLGLNLERLTIALYGDQGSVGTAKARVSRLRNSIPLTSRPYQIGVPFRADFLDLMEHLEQGRVRQALSLYRGPLLPDSEAPAVIELREHIDESLRQAVLASGDHEAMLELAKRTDDQDLELLEAAARHIPQNDPQLPLLRARIRQIRRDWGSDDDGER
jgi:tetratricopeptide (TPR) repeat protein